MRTDTTPPEAAHELLKQAGGVQRNAEVKAWEYAYGHGLDKPLGQMWVAVVRHIVEGTEIPPVQRREYHGPALTIPAA